MLCSSSLLLSLLILAPSCVRFQDDDEASDKGSASGDEEAGDPDAYEDDEDDDYGDNYFDNGEDRDEVEPTGAAEGEYE